MGDSGGGSIPNCSGLRNGEGARPGNLPRGSSGGGKVGVVLIQVGVLGKGPKSDKFVRCWSWIG